MEEENKELLSMMSHRKPFRAVFKFIADELILKIQIETGTMNWKEMCGIFGLIYIVF